MKRRTAHGVDQPALALQMAAQRPRLTLKQYVALENELHASVYAALHVLLPNDAVLNTWELRNASSAVEGARRKRLGALAGWPDMGVFWRGHCVLLELKRERGGHLSAVQRELHPRLA